MNKNFTLFLNRNAGWLIIAVLTLIPVVRWFQINSLDLAFDSGFTFFSMVGRLAGLVGIVLYAVNFVLSTRLRFLESLFGGLNRAYIAHHIVGGLALLALLIHPLALALRYVPDNMSFAADFLLPDVAGDIDWPVNYGHIAFIGLVFLMIVTLFVKLPYELWLFTHKFLGLAFLFGGLHAMFIPSDTSDDTFMRWYILSLAGLGILAFTYRTLLARVFIRRAKYEIIRVYEPTDRVTHIVMKPVNKRIDYKPGQFIFIRFKQDGITPEPHPFSISSAPGGDKELLSVTVKALGDFTGTLNQLKAGTTAEIEGAFGRFTNTRYRQPKQIWIAGGIGITPFLSMAKSATRAAVKNKGSAYDIHMFYVVRNAQELIDHDNFQKISNAKGLNFSYNTYIAEEQKDLINADYIAEHADGLDNADVFICGPPPMMKSLKQQLIKKGVKKRNIHTEEFSIS